MVSQGASDTLPNPAAKFFAMQWNADGTLDTSFGTNGVTSAALASDVGDIYDAVVHSDGSSSWLLDEEHAMGASVHSFSVWNVSAQGTVQKTTPRFAPDLSDVGLSAVVTLQGDGKVVFAGTRRAGGIEMWRYATDGSLDASFGQGGTALPASADIVAIDGVRANVDDTLDMVVTQSMGTKQSQGACGPITVPEYGLAILHFAADGTPR
jgi:hypothetical protein